MATTQKGGLSSLWQKQQRLIVIQVFIFLICISVIVITGAVVYSKTSIHDIDRIEQKRTIEGGFLDLRRAVEEGQR